MVKKKEFQISDIIIVLGSDGGRRLRIGTAIHCSCSDEQGNQIDSSLCIEREAHFTGEDAAWLKFLQKNLNPEVPVNNRAPAGIYMVVVQFVVDKNGDITDIKPLTNFGFG